MSCLLRFGNSRGWVPLPTLPTSGILGGIIVSDLAFALASLSCPHWYCQLQATFVQLFE